MRDLRLRSNSPPSNVIPSHALAAGSTSSAATGATGASWSGGNTARPADETSHVNKPRISLAHRPDHLNQWENGPTPSLHPRQHNNYRLDQGDQNGLSSNDNMFSNSIMDLTPNERCASILPPLPHYTRQVGVGGAGIGGGSGTVGQSHCPWIYRGWLKISTRKLYLFAKYEGGEGG